MGDFLYLCGITKPVVIGAIRNIMPKFEKGNSGRPKGTKNKKTEQWEALGDAITGKLTDKLTEEMGKLKGKDFIMAYSQILEYFKPKLQRTEMKSENKTTLNINPIEWVD